MMKRFLIIIAAALASALPAMAQVDLEKEFFSLPDSVTNSYLDSIDVKKQEAPNNYLMVGVYGGVTMNYGFFNPTRLVSPHWAYPMGGFSIIRQFNMFGIFPNMGFEFGAQLNYEGYEFKENKETGYRATESGAYAVTMRVPEVFMLSHFHIDAGDHFKLLAKIGIYGGYRLDIQRTLDPYYAEFEEYTQYESSFRDYDKRFTYGVQGGLGMGLMFSPFEFHIMAQVKWGWESFWVPNYASQWYYRFAYPLDGAITFGIYYQLTPRLGHSRASLRKLAKQMVKEQYETKND